MQLLISVIELLLRLCYLVNIICAYNMSVNVYVLIVNVSICCCMSGNGSTWEDQYITRIFICATYDTVLLIEA